MEQRLNEAPTEAEWRKLPGKVRHTFTHFHLELDVAIGHCQAAAPIDGIWCDVTEFGRHALPTVMKKVVAHALKHQD
jgi:A/G-specific adenine glycosylase